MKRLICMICVMTLVLALAACGKEEPTLCDRGLEVIDLMEEAIHSEAYLDLMSAAQPLREKIAQAAQGDYRNPKAVYAISFSTDVLQMYSGVLEPVDLPETLTDVVEHRLLAALVSQVNAAGGMEALAASAMCTVSKTFVGSEPKQDLIYLYTFESGCPVAVTFTTGEDNSVSATATIILYEDFPSGSAAEIQAFFGGKSVAVTCISGS